MTATELINELITLREKYGDFPIFKVDYGNLQPLTKDDITEYWTTRGERSYVLGTDF